MTLIRNRHVNRFSDQVGLLNRSDKNKLLKKKKKLSQHIVLVCRKERLIERNDLRT